MELSLLQSIWWGYIKVVVRRYKIFNTDCVDLRGGGSGFGFICELMVQWIAMGTTKYYGKNRHVAEITQG